MAVERKRRQGRQCLLQWRGRAGFTPDFRRARSAGSIVGTQRRTGSRSAQEWSRQHPSHGVTAQARRHVRLQPVGRQAVSSPHPSHHHMRHAQLLAQSAGAPVRGSIGGTSPGELQNPGFHLRGEHRRRLSAMPTIQAGQPLPSKPAGPARDVTITAVEPPPNVDPGYARRRDSGPQSGWRLSSWSQPTPYREAWP